MSVERVVIVDYVRTPFTKAADPTSGREPGKLTPVNPVDAAATLLRTLIERTGADPKHIDSVIAGCVNQEAEQGLNPARMAVLHPESGLPVTVQGISVDQFCASAAWAIGAARNQIAMGDADMIIAGGMQWMGRIPMGGWNPVINEQVYEAHPKRSMDMGATAENLAERYDISREEQDSFALESHRKLAAAQKAGHYDHEIVPLAGVSTDDNVRPDSKMEDLAKLRPAFKAGGSVTAANSSPITDGAAFILMASESYAKENNLPVRAHVVAQAGAGVEPEIMGIGPVEAVQKALDRAHLTIDQIDVVEINEAFAAQVLAVLKDLDGKNVHIAPEKLNIDGGAIALGPPLGASGARLVGHAVEILERTGGRYALATMCVGQGQAQAIIIENPNAGRPAAPAPSL